MALFIRKELLSSAPDDSNYIYRDPEGKALAVTLTIGKTPFLFIIVHAPHTDAEQEAFLQKLQANIPSPSRDGVTLLMGDFNFVDSPTFDIEPSQTKNKSPRAIQALVALRNHLGGLVDAFRCIHPFETFVTCHKNPISKSRYDRGYVSSHLVRADKAPCLRTMQHIPRHDLMVTTPNNGRYMYLCV